MHKQQVINISLLFKFFSLFKSSGCYFFSYSSSYFSNGIRLNVFFSSRYRFHSVVSVIYWLFRFDRYLRTDEREREKIR